MPTMYRDFYKDFPISGGAHVGIPSLCWNNTKALVHSVLRVAVVILIVDSRSDVMGDVVSRTGGLFDGGGGGCVTWKKTHGWTQITFGSSFCFWNFTEAFFF